MHQLLEVLLRALVDEVGLVDGDERALRGEERRRADGDPEGVRGVQGEVEEELEAVGVVGAEVEGGAGDVVRSREEFRGKEGGGDVGRVLFVAGDCGGGEVLRSGCYGGLSAMVFKEELQDEVGEWAGLRSRKAPSECRQ